jgi:hypothetical protein
VALAYQRAELRRATIVLCGLVLAYVIFGNGSTLWNALLIVLAGGLQP